MLVHSSIADLASIEAPVHLAIGVFDGVHRGHQEVISSAVAQASADGGEAVMVTFDPHPVCLLAPDKAPRMLTSHRHKLRLAGELGICHVMVIPFDRGVCGAAARTGETQVVADVEAFPGHIACSSSTRSEIVLPVWDKSGSLIAVFDIDSDQEDAFSDDDAAALQEILNQAEADNE